MRVNIRGSAGGAKVAVCKVIQTLGMYFPHRMLMGTHRQNNRRNLKPSGLVKNPTRYSNSKLTVSVAETYT